MVQVLLVVLAATLVWVAGYSLGRARGLDEAAARDRFDTPRRPSAVQVGALLVLAAVAGAGAWALQGPEGVRMPVPARLDELAGRAEDVAIGRATEHAPRDGAQP